MRYGADGYALYWLCLELIAAPIDKQSLSFELEHDCDILAYRLKIDSSRVSEIMSFFVAQELFEQSSTTNRITCLKLAKRLEYSVVKNPQLRAAQKQIADQEAEALLLESVTIPDNLGQSRLEEIRLDKKVTNTSEPQASSNTRISKSDHEMVIGIYHQVLPELSGVLISRWHGSSHAKQLSARWREDSKFRTVEFWTAFFETVRLNNWWMGVADQNGGACWDKCNLAWLVKRENFDKVLAFGMSKAS